MSVSPIPLLGLSDFPLSPTEGLELSLPHSHSQLVLVIFVDSQELPQAWMVLEQLKDLQSQL